MNGYRLHSEALADLSVAMNYYESSRPGLGDAFADATKELIDSIRIFPQLYAKVDRCRRGREIRVTMVGQFNYAFVYEVTTGDIVVFSIIHGSSRKQPWRKLRP